MTSIVLLIDDDPGVLQSYERMLRLEGYTVVTAQNAEDGLSEAQRHQPDAVFLDLRMPLVDGLQFLRRLREDKALRTIPVAIVTGDYLVDESTVDDLQALGAEIRLKPLWLEDLVALASQLITARGEPPRDRGLAGHL